MMRQAVASCTSNGKEVGIPVGSRHLTDLDYADDIALLADNEADLQFFIDQVVFFAGMVGLKINADKTKMMSICSPVVPKITVEGVEVENVETFRYLGSLITTRSSNEDDVLARIGFAQASFQQLYPCLFSRQDVSISTKMRVYLASVRSILLYVAESLGPSPLPSLPPWTAAK